MNDRKEKGGGEEKMMMEGQMDEFLLLGQASKITPVKRARLNFHRACKICKNFNISKL